MSRVPVKCVFLSRVNADFGSDDERIGRHLGVGISANSVMHQTAATRVQAAYGVLHKLLELVRVSDVVIHYVGRTLGSSVASDEVDAFLQLEPQLASWLAEKRLQFESWTYTQWEAYMALFVLSTERSAGTPLALISYQVVRFGEGPVAEVAAHLRALTALHKGAETVELPRYTADDDARALFLSSKFRESTIVWPTPRAGMLSARRQVEVVNLLQDFVQDGFLSCADIAALAFPLNPRVVDLPVSYLEVRQFVANFVECLKGASDCDAVGAVWTYIYAMIVLLRTRNHSAANRLDIWLNSALIECDSDGDAIVNAYQRMFPDCFPRYPLRLCVEVFVRRLASRLFAVNVSYRVGSYRRFIMGDTSPGGDTNCVDDPRKAVDLALSRTGETAARLGGLERVELMIDGAMLDSDEAWHWLASSDWNPTPTDPDSGDSEPVVLRWPHTEKSAALVTRISPESTIDTRAIPGGGVHVLRGRPTGAMLNIWRQAFKTSTLTFWERGQTAVPAGPATFHWSQVPRLLQQPEWREVGVALNPPEALVYRGPGQAAVRLGNRIQQLLR
jgi:hypothetical protein